VENVAVLANSLHADSAGEKIADGMPTRDALGLTLLAMDYEKDDYSMPRIVTLTKAGKGEGWLATAGIDLDVRSFALEPGNVRDLSTYEHNAPDRPRVSAFTAETGQDACDLVVSEACSESS
jgi:IMP cyclohydrolase